LTKATFTCRSELLFVKSGYLDYLQVSHSFAKLKRFDKSRIRNTDNIRDVESKMLQVRGEM